MERHRCVEDFRRSLLTALDMSYSTLESLAASIASLYEPFVFDDDALAIDVLSEPVEQRAS